MEILTFREWKDEHVKVLSDIGGKKITVKSLTFDNVIIDIEDEKIIKEFNHNPSSFLLRYYQVNFNRIQKEFKTLLDIVEKNK